MFAEYCSMPFEVEPVEVIDSFGESHGEALPLWERVYGACMKESLNLEPAEVIDSFGESHGEARILMSISKQSDAAFQTSDKGRHLASFADCNLPARPAPVYPDLAPREMEVETSYINGVLGLELAQADITRLLRRCVWACICARAPEISMPSRPLKPVFPPLIIVTAACRVRLLSLF